MAYHMNRFQQPGATANSALKTEALYLTWTSLLYAAIINLLLIILPLPPIIYIPLYLLALIGEIGAMLTLYFFMPKTESGRRKLLYVFVISTSILLSGLLKSIIFTYSNGFLIVVGAFGITSAVAGIMYYIAASKTPNLQFMSKYLLFALIGLIVVTILGIFISYNAFFELIISLFGAALFSVWLLFDLSRLERKEFFSPAMMALSIYWDLLLLFKYLLRIMVMLLGNKD